MKYKISIFLYNICVCFIYKNMSRSNFIPESKEI